MENEKVNLKNKSVLIYDFGLCSEFAVRMARDFGKVYYYCVWEDAFPKSNKALVGEGMEGVIRVLNFWDYLDKVDLICFFDTYCADLVEYLKNKGHRVWGAGKSEILENNRWKGRGIQEALGLPVQKTVKIVGIDNLIEYLKRNTKKWVKLNMFRGDIETFFHDTYDETQAQFLGKLMQEIGAKGKTLEFVLEDEVGESEPGYDGWVVDGKYPSISMWGYEQKGTGYIGKVESYQNLPKSLKEINDKLSSVFTKLGGRTLFSTEVRVTKGGKGYLIDPCVRAPMPVPSAIHLELWKNFSEIIWFGAEGKLITPIPTAKYGAGVCIESDWAEENWAFIDIPKDKRQWVKLRMAFKTKEGKFYALPGFKSVGSIIGLGNSIQEAISKVKENSKDVKIKEMSFSLSGLEEIAQKVIPEGRKYGLPF
jgi:hypothetical protein